MTKFLRERQKRTKNVAGSGGVGRRIVGLDQKLEERALAHGEFVQLLRLVSLSLYLDAEIYVFICVFFN